MSVNFVNGDNGYSDYIDLVNQAVNNEEIFKIFKSHNNYTGILEHVSQYQGQQYLFEINKYTKLPNELWEQFLLNDSIGSPNKYLYELPIGNKYVSPTTLRYIKFSLDIINFIKNHVQKNGINIVEIGGGYGGLCKVLLDICEYYGIDIYEYTIYDLEDVSKLSKKYLDTIPHGKCDNLRTGTLVNCEPPSRIDLVLAFYSYSEISEEFRKLYCETIISNSLHGYFAWNFNMTNEEIKNELSKNISIEEEVPLTGQFNKIVFW